MIKALLNYVANYCMRQKERRNTAKSSWPTFKLISTLFMGLLEMYYSALEMKFRQCKDGEATCG